MAAQPQERVRKRLVWFSPVLFAVALSPAFLQTQYTCDRRTGDTRLASLELEVDETDRLTFDPAVRVYDLWLPAGATSATVRAVPMDLAARVTWYVPDGAGMLASGIIGVGGGEVTVDLPPDGYSLYIGVFPPGGATNTYIVAINPACTAGSSCSDGNDCTADYCDPGTEQCVLTPVADDTPCDFNGLPGLCFAGVCEEDDSCPVLTRLTVTPLQADVGDEIDLSSEASDEQGDAIDYLWSGSGGVFADPSAASTTYTCLEIGQHDINIAVSDDDFTNCIAEWTIIIECVSICSDDVDCHDGNDCTADDCDPAMGFCTNDPLPDGTSCDFAGGAGECNAGSCEDAPGWGAPDSWVTPEFLTGTDIHLSPNGVAIASKLITTFPGPDPNLRVLCRDAIQLVPGEGWSDSITRLSCLGPRALSSYLGIDAAGNAISLTSWLFQGSSSVTLSAARFTPENGWEGSGVPGVGPYKSGWEFRAAMADDGRLTLVWVYGLLAEPTVRALRFTPVDGWGDPGGGIVAEVPSNALTRSVAVGPNGHAIALWSETGELWSSSFDEASGWGPAELVGVTTFPSLHAWVNGQGRGLVAWEQDDAGVDTLWTTRYTPSVGWGAAEQFERDDLMSAGLPLMELDDEGDGVAVWIQSDLVWANTLTGSGWGVPHRIDRGGTHIASNLTFDMNPAGEAIAAWVQEDAGVYSIWWTRFTPDIGWRPSKVFEDVGATSSYSPSTRIAEDGTAVVLWFRDGTTWMSRFE